MCTAGVVNIKLLNHQLKVIYCIYLLQRSQQEAIAKNITLVETTMRELCRNVLRVFMQNPPAADAALTSTAGPIRSKSTEEMIQQLKVSTFTSASLYL